VRLPLLESHTETTDFGFQARDMAHRADSNAPEIVSATASFSEFAGILISSATFCTHFGSLTACCVRVGHRPNDAGRQETEFESSLPRRISARENRHTQHSLFSSEADVIRTRSPWEPQKFGIYRQR
jgi:hypothetical protein